MKPTSFNASLVRSSKRFLQTVQQPSAATVSPMVFGVHNGINNPTTSSFNHTTASAAPSKESEAKWTTYSLPKFGSAPLMEPTKKTTPAAAKGFSVPFGQPLKPVTATPLQTQKAAAPLASAPPPASKPAGSPAKISAPRRKLRPRKAAISLTPTAITHLRSLLDQPSPKLIRIGVKNRGCSGLTYHLEYVDKPGQFDEEIVQEGVKVLIDSKALFSIIGSEMDWVDDKLSSRFVFTNPNSKGQCGCGESFMV